MDNNILSKVQILGILDQKRFYYYIEQDYLFL